MTYITFASISNPSGVSADALDAQPQRRSTPSPGFTSSPPATGMSQLLAAALIDPGNDHYDAGHTGGNVDSSATWRIPSGGRAVRANRCF